MSLRIDLNTNKTNRLGKHKLQHIEQVKILQNVHKDPVNQLHIIRDIINNEMEVNVKEYTMEMFVNTLVDNEDPSMKRIGLTIVDFLNSYVNNNEVVLKSFGNELSRGIQVWKYEWDGRSRYDGLVVTYNYDIEKIKDYTLLDLIAITYNYNGYSHTINLLWTLDRLIGW